MRSLALLPATTALLIAACTACAQARTEFCPSSLWYRPAAPAASDGRSKGVVYGLWARSPRTIDHATIVADTDGGWYSWDVSNMPLTLRTTGDGESTRRVADFDKAVVIRHVWVMAARASGDTEHEWDAKGEVSCGVPAFGAMADAPQKAEPAVGFPHAPAKPIPAPFTVDCAEPFVAAFVARPVQPNFPRSVPPGSYSSQVEVEIGDHDDVVDAWIYKPSVQPAIDASALAAARASTYQSAISYCRKAVGNYLFRAEFRP